MPNLVAPRSHTVMPPSKRSEYPGASEVRNLCSEGNALNTLWSQSFRSEFRAEVQLPESTSLRHNNGCPISLSLHR